VASPDTTTQSVEEMLTEAIAELGPKREDIKREATFESLDVDSLDLVEIAQRAEEAYGVEINPQDMGDVKTVGDAIDLVLARVQ
jgi:acyl carrier protein